MRKRLSEKTLSVYLLTLLASAAAVLLRWLLDPTLDDRLPLVTLYGAVAFAVWLGGYRPAVATAAVGFLACDYLFMEPRYALPFPSLADLVGAIAYTLTCSIIIGFGEAMRRAQRLSRDERELLRVTFGSIGDAVIATDTEGRITYINPVAQSLTGWSRKDAVGCPVDQVFHIVDEETGEAVENPAARVLREGAIVGLGNHTVLITREGEQRPIDDSAAPIKNEDGDVLGVVMVFRDVTERRRLERLRHDLNRELERQVAERTAELRSSEERFRLLVDGSKEHAIYLLDPHGRIASWNPGAERIKQYKADEVLGQHFSIFYTEEAVRAGIPQTALRTAESKGTYEENGWRVRKDGTRFWASVVITALRDDAGNLRGFSKVVQDISDRKRAEESARRLVEEETARRITDEYNRVVEAQREQFRVTLRSIGDAVIATDAEGRVTFLNPIAERLTGWSDAEAQGQPLSAVFFIVNEFTKKAAENPVERVLATGTIVGLANHTLLIAKDGTERAIADSGAPIRGQDGRTIGVVLVFRDVTEERRAEASLRRQADLLEQAHDAIFVSELGGPIIYWNKSAERLYGFSKQEAVGKDRDTLLRSAFPGGEAAAFRRAMETNGEFNGEIVHTTKSGDPIAVEVRSRLMTEADGRKVVLETARDVTERKRLEMDLRQKVDELAVADRRKDEFMATLAHELRNPLAPIRNAVGILLMRGAPDPELKWARDVIERQVKSMSRMLDDLFDVSRVSYNKVDLRKERIELSALIDMAVETSRTLIDARGHHLSVSLPAKPIYLEVDPVRIVQVFANLLSNAARYTKPGGAIHLTAERHGREIVVSVKDNGIGISPAMLPHVFEIFAQAERPVEVEAGIGIGLWLVRGLVELHDGTVEARSDGSGRGSEFIVTLPAVIEEPPELPLPHPPDVQKSRVVERRRILVVDDVKDNADSLAKLLEIMGHEVRAVYSGENAAVEAAAFHPEVVLLDVGMPTVDGLQVCREIRSQPWGKKISVVAVTGWGQDGDRERTQAAGFDAHIVKPVDPDALGELLASVPREKRAG